jgi:hypothetical protein
MAAKQLNIPFEEWKAIPGFPGYEVSDRGRVRSYFQRKGRQWKGAWKHAEAPQRIIKPRISRGYLTVSLCRDGKRHTVDIHRLVLLAFIGPCPPGMEACHGDGVRHHCTLNNLRWDTTSNNHLDKREHGTDSRGEKSGKAKLTDDQVIKIREMASKGCGCRKLAKIFPATYGHIAKIIRRELWKHI